MSKISKLKRNPLFVFGPILIITFWAATGRPAIPVVDVGSIEQTTITAVKTAAMLKNQIEQMKSDLDYMNKQLQTLSQLGWQDSYKLQQHLEFFDSLRGKVDTLMFDYRQMDNRFRDLYSTKDAPVSKKLADWNAQTERSILAAMKAHGAVNNSEATLRSVSNLIEKQRRAQGDLAAIQTLGELSAIQTRQMEELKTIVALDSRAKQSQLMEEKSQKKAQKDFENYLMSDVNKKEKLKPMRKLPKLGEGIK